MQCSACLPTTSGPAALRPLASCTGCADSSQMIHLPLQAWDSGRMVIVADPRGPRPPPPPPHHQGGDVDADEQQEEGVWPPAPIELQLPCTVDASSAEALMTGEGQLYIRVNRAL